MKIYENLENPKNNRSENLSDFKTIFFAIFQKCY